ncbi:MAG: DUF3047 domain-containing protein [Mariprofundus sp.]
MIHLPRLIYGPVFQAVMMVTSILCLSSPILAASITITDFNRDTLHGWEPKKFKGETLYSLQRDSSNRCIRAESIASASGLFRKVHIDLEKTPYLHWRWKIDQPLDNRHETEKKGDDFTARIYLIVSGGLFFWNTRAINYVWANQQQAESSWVNPYTSNSAMLAVESGPQHAGQWREYRRNARQDLKRFFGKDFKHIDAVAIMTDTDDTGKHAVACYGEIRFSDH